MSYIGLDIGSSGCKASVVSKDAVILATAYREYSFVLPQAGMVELDPVCIWSSVKEVLRELAPYCADVKGLAVSSIGESFVFLDENEMILNNFILYADQRCDGIEKLVLDKMDDRRLYEITAVIPNQFYSLYKVVWFQQNQPEVLAKAESIYFAIDYFNYLLTGKRAIDCSTASKTMMFDAHNHDWSDDILMAFDISKDLFSPVKEVGSIIGPILPELAAELDLPKDIIVYLGCHDQASAALGAGAFLFGNTMINDGSTESINTVVDSSIFDKIDILRANQICAEAFLSKGKYILPLGHLTFGTCLKWYVNALESDRIQLAHDNGESIYTYLDARCAESTELVFLPYMSKVNAMDPEACALGGFIGINMATSREEMYRSILEGLNFESKMNFDLLGNLNLSLDRITATGGFSKSKLAMQMKADIFQKEIYVLENTEAGITGLAIICAVAMGDFDNYEQAIDNFVKIKNSYRPIKNYSQQYRRYRIMSATIKKAYADI